MHLLVVGSISLDSVETPLDRVENVIGGSSCFFASAASYFTDVRIVGVVGNDFPLQELNFLKSRNVDFTGLRIMQGKTFRWGGKYFENMNDRETLFTELNVFQEFNPIIPVEYHDSEFVFLANIQPDLQLNVLNQVRSPRFVALDTMNYWISGMLPALKKIIARVDLLTLNDQEVAQLSGEKNVLAGARKILKMGPKALIVKRGEFGASLVTADSYFWIPAYPVEKVIDPTGAGDTFAGAFMGYLSRTNDLSEPNMRRAIAFGTALASFCVEDFSLNRLRNIPKTEINERFQKLLDMIKCEPGEML